MTSFRKDSLVFIAAGLSLLVLITDLLTPLGYAVWLFYMVPIALLFSSLNPKTLFVAATWCSVLIVAGLFLSPPGVAASVAVTNRTLAMSLLWLEAAFLSRLKRSMLERKRAEEAVREREQHLSLIYDTVSDVLFYLAVEPEDRFRFLSVNRVFLQATGLREDQVVGKLIQEVIPEPAREFVLGKYHQAIRERRTVTWDEVSGYPAGENHGEVSITPVLDPDGNCRHLVGTVHDITERKQAEAALSESEARLRLVLDGLGSQMFVGLLDTAGVILAANRPALEAAGLRLEDVLGKPVHETYWFTYSDDVAQRFRAAVQRSAQGETVRYDEQIRIAEGQLIWVAFTVHPVRDESGKVAYLVPSAVVIHERKLAEAALWEAHDRLAKIVATAPGIVCSFRLRPDGSACFPYGGERLAELYGITAGRLAEDAAALFAQVHPDDLGNMKETIVESARRLSPWRCEWRVRHPARGELWLEGHSMPVREPDGSTMWHGVVTDITARRQAEEARHKSEQRVRDILASITSGYQIIDRHGRYAEFNDAARKMIVAGGRDPDALLGQHVLEAFPETRDLAGTHALFRTLTERVPTEAENFYEAWHRWFAVRNYPTPDGGVAMFFDDITERKRAEEAVRESAARLRLLVEAANVGLWDWDLQTNSVYFSPEWKRQIGYRDDEIPNDFAEWQSRVHPDDIEPTLQKVRAFLANPQGRHEAEFRFRHKDGSYRWIYTHGDVLRDAAGKPTRMLGCHTDITERKRAEEERRQVFERVSDAFVALDKDWRYTYVNAKAGEMFGRRPEDLIGKHIWTEFPEGVGQPFHHAYERAVAEQTPIIFEDYYGPYDRWFENRIYPSPDGLTIFFTDITERKRAEQKIREQLEELQRWYRVMLSREERVQELKREVNELLIRLGEPMRYSSQEVQPHGEAV
jgi:PAS domain S-box-containing protein